MLLVICIFIYSINSSTFSNHLNPHLGLVLNSIFMESFGFFTKDPKGENIEIYKIEFEQKKLVNLKTNSFENSFGFSRKQRRKTFEVGILLKEYPDSNWRKTTMNNIDKIELSNISFYEVKNPRIILLEEGDYMLIAYKPIVWEWNTIKKDNECRYAFINVKRI